MKKISILIGFTLAIVSLSLVSMVFAADHSFGGLTTNGGGTVWQVNFNALPGYTADDVDLAEGVTANVYIGSDPTPISLTIRDVVIRNGALIIYFKGADLPQDVTATNVIGHFDDETTFLATGVGFAWRRR